MGCQHNEFLKAYYNNIKYQNTEVIDSNPIAFAVKKFVESVDLTTNNNYGQVGSSGGYCTVNINSNKRTYFVGTPAELLKNLNDIAENNQIDTRSVEWPKDQKWLVRRIKYVKSNLQQDLDVSIGIKRGSRNTCLIEIEKNLPHDEKLSPCLNEMSPEKVGLSPDNNRHLSTESATSGDNGDNGDISPISKEDERIGFREPLYYCKQHLSVQNIHLEEIEHHIQYSKDHA
jgi:hypothetical protein